MESVTNCHDTAALVGAPVSEEFDGIAVYGVVVDVAVARPDRSSSSAAVVPSVVVQWTHAGRKWTSTRRVDEMAAPAASRASADRRLAAMRSVEQRYIPDLAMLNLMNDRVPHACRVSHEMERKRERERESLSLWQVGARGAARQRGAGRAKRVRRGWRGSLR